jgi:hypothetical protein
MAKPKKQSASVVLSSLDDASTTRSRSKLMEPPSPA